MAHSDIVVATSWSLRPQLTNTLAILLALCALSAEGSDKELFPRPVSLQPAIDFWTRVYTEVDSRAGYVHDSRNLNIVYEKLQFKQYSSPDDQ
jgi:membrane-bound lytic murein transglycosylase D